MGQIRDLQWEQQRWRTRNFPNNLNPDGAFLGMVEEVGELAHVTLKVDQGIRGYQGLDGVVKAEEDAQDCIGDLYVFMMSYCNARGWDLEEIITETWEQVKTRDWILYPDTGRPPDAPTDVGS